ncbi:energy-coupling factor transporter ATPase [Abyssicoccus albus]|uniref:Energy-coupling factor transport system ATP-binding protein n=1 Tax=Abyssicoccus albus TaxID=1817405 RepID=A0A3N5BGD3_9BACL|nr:energy-coupling factor transporter ATPase [Abyssicoccus albus]RPF56563.1 energy-coupling factor transport system ATP-binding protein [Abyssicoccus albus]
MFEFDHVSFQYKQSSERIIDQLSFQIQPTQHIAIIGANGSGKSTIAKLALSILNPTEGKIKEKPNLKKSIVFQNPDNQFVGVTVEDDIAFGLEYHQIPQYEMKDRIYESLELVDMIDYLQHEVSKLSGGQKQRVALAGALAIQPDLIFLDEVTSMLDPNGRQQFGDILKRLKHRQQMSMIQITHDMEEAKLADLVIVMNDGRKIMEGSPEEIFTRVDELRAVGLTVPYAMRIAHEMGMDTSVYITEDELVNRI